MVEAGRLRQRVTIQTAEPSSDAYGKKPNPTWTDVRTVWAEVRPLRANEVIRAHQAGMETAYVVTMRYTPDMTADGRLKWGERYLYPSGVIDLEGRHVALEIMCQERSGNA